MFVKFSSFFKVSRPYNVRVLESLVFSKNQPEKITGYTAGSVQLTCDIDVEVERAWYKNGELVRKNEKVLLLPNGSLEIMDLTRSDGGSYTCHGKLGSLTGIRSVKLDIRPTIIEKDTPKLVPAPPPRKSVVLGETVFLPCHAFDRAPDSSKVNITWILPNG